MDWTTFVARTRLALRLVSLSRLSLPLVALVALAGSARAQNASTPGALELYPTFQSIGARLTYAGDDNANASAYLEWRTLGGAWRRGVDLSRFGATRRWAGSVLWLQPGVPFEVRAVIVDPEGGGSASGIATTRSSPYANALGRAFWVSTAGNDAGIGTGAQPLATWQAAADRARPGDEIRILPGVYYQTLDTPRAGTSDSLIHVVADGPGVVLDGSDPSLLHGAPWHDDGGGIFSIPFAGTTRLVCADSLDRLYRQSTLAQMQSNFNGMTRSWATEGGRLYVKVGDSPANHTMHIARGDVGVRIDQDFWHLKGLEIRYFGSMPAPIGQNLPHSSGILVAGADRCWIESNHVHTIGGRGIYLIELAAENLIEGNLCRDPRIGAWDRTVSKSHEEEIQGISMRGGRGNVIRDNTCQGTFDGIDAAHDDGPENENIAADLDIHDNLVIGFADDGIEPETISGINVRVWHNRVDGGDASVSIAPNLTGPTYVLYNTLLNYKKRGYKSSHFSPTPTDTIRSTGVTWFCHNTVTSSVNATAAFWPTGFNGSTSNKHFRNNILVGRGDTPVDDDGEASQGTGNDFDGDVLQAIGFGAIFSWPGDFPTIAALRTATGFEIHGRVGDPLFVSPAAGNYGLSAGSPAIDAGVLLSGINDCYTGLAPDAGASEFCVNALLAVGGPAVEPGVSVERAFPNPSSGLTRVRFTAPRSARVRVRVFDPLGRQVATLADRERTAGAHEILWDGRDASGARVRAGVYFASIEIGGQVVWARIVRLE